MGGHGKATRTAVCGYAFEVTVGDLQRRLGSGREIDLNIVGNEQVEQAVAVVIDKRTARAEAIVAGLMQSGLVGDVGECAVAVIAVEPVLSVVGKEEIFEAVVVVVADANTLGPASVREAGFGSHIGECAVAVVVIEAVAGAGRNAFQTAASEDEGVHPAVIVVVEKRATGAIYFDNVDVSRGVTVKDSLCETRTLAHINEARKRSSFRRRQQRARSLRQKQHGRQHRRQSLQQATPGPVTVFWVFHSDFIPELR